VPTIAFADRAVRVLIRSDLSDEAVATQDEERRAALIHAEPDTPEPEADPESATKID
jgi:hypothetical protein